MSQSNLESVISNTVAKLHQQANDGNATSQKTVEELTGNGWRVGDITVPAVLHVVRLLRKAGEQQLAQEILFEAVVAYSDQAEVLTEQASLYFDSSKYDQAVDWFKKTIETKPDKELQIKALIASGAALRNLRHFDDAAEMFQQALDAEGGKASAALVVQQAWLCFYRKSFADAYDLFENAVAQLIGKEKHEARVGLLASRRELDLLSPADQPNSRQLVSDWLNNEKEDRNEVVSIFIECSESVLEHLNRYPAALENAEHLIEVTNGYQQDSPDKIAALQSGIYFKMNALKWLRRYARAERTYHDSPSEVRTCIRVWNELANCYFEQKRFVEAQRHYSGEAVADANLTDEQKKELKKGLKKNPEACEWNIVTLRKMREFKKAHEEVANALSELEEKLPFISESAALHYAERNYDTAIKLFDRALQMNDYDTFALQWRAASLRKRGDLPGAQKLLAEALTKVPFSTRLWEEWGWLAYDQGNSEEAIRAFDKAIELDPYLINKQFAKVETLLRLSRSDDALQVFKKLEQQFPDDAEVREQLCWFHIRMNEIGLAQETQIKLRQSHPNSTLGLNAQGGCELVLKRYEVAEKAFRNAIKQVSYEPQYYVNLAFALIRQVPSPRHLSKLESPKRTQIIEEAKQHCRTALDRDPYHAKAYECLGIIAFKDDLVFDAEYYFRKSIELNSKEEASYVQLGSLYCQKACYDKATEMLQKALEINPKEARAYIELANVAALKKENQEAIHYCRQAVFVQPKNLGTHRALAIALMHAGQYAEAELVVRRALRDLAAFNPWRLYLLLAQILISIADIANKSNKKTDLDLYEEALGYVNRARQAHAPSVDTLFHMGIVQYKLEDLDSSHRSFSECLKLEPGQLDAERNNRIVQNAINNQRRYFKINERFSHWLALICLAGLLVLWGAYFRGHKRSVPIDTNAQAAATNSQREKDEMTVDRELLHVMTPLLLGLFTIAALLPNLSKLKLPGFEAEIADPKPASPDISTGPRGEIGFGSSLPVIDPQPR